MSRDALPPSVDALRSLTSFVQQLDGYDPEDCLYEGQEKSAGVELANVLKYLRCLRGFLTSARARIIEAGHANVKEQLAVLSIPIQQLSNHIFLLERGGTRTPEELRTLLEDLIKSLLEWGEEISSLASKLNAAG